MFVEVAQKENVKPKRKKIVPAKSWRPAGSTHPTPPPSSSQPLPPGALSARKRKPAIPSTRPSTPTANEQAKKMQYIPNQISLIVDLSVITFF